MIYDFTIDMLKLLFGALEFLKPYATIGGVIFLILRQNGIKKIINGHLPRRFRDTRDSDIQEIKQDIKEIKSHLGVASSNLQPNGLRTTEIQLYKRFFLLLLKVTILRRKKVMDKLKSRKLWLALLGAIIPVLNVELGLNLDAGTVWTIIVSIIAGIAGLAHVDAKKAAAAIKPPASPDDQNYSH